MKHAEEMDRRGSSEIPREIAHKILFPKYKLLFLLNASSAIVHSPMIVVEC